jgi:hypothetical protein
MSSVQVAERRREEVQALSPRLRAVEILREDFRGRRSIARGERADRGDQAAVFVLSTTADELGPGSRRAAEVTYVASREGLTREEAFEDGSPPFRLQLLREPVRIEFGGDGVWRAAPWGDGVKAMRISFLNSRDMVVLR